MVMSTDVLVVTLDSPGFWLMRLGECYAGVAGLGISVGSNWHAGVGWRCS